ncbi:hypothetical protein B0H10DRAFT_2051673, partial [Mycena sp. CBHHK59/15]
MAFIGLQSLRRRHRTAAAMIFAVALAVCGFPRKVFLAGPKSSLSTGNAHAFAVLNLRSSPTDVEIISESCKIAEAIAVHRRVDNGNN